MYRAVTRDIEVVVTPRFVADRSSPENNYFFWAYTIAITNNGGGTVQLKTRHWRIIDASGRRQEAVSYTHLMCWTSCQFRITAKRPNKSTFSSLAATAI